MTEHHLTPYLEQLAQRQTKQGGFPDQTGGTDQPDATAWAVCILQQDEQFSTTLKPARESLTKHQFPNGSVPIVQEHPDAVWPTPLSILAWHGSSVHHSQQQQAVQFLLSRYGHHWTAKQENDDSRLEHDPAIHGWPWVANTHSWVSPTALAMLALSVTGYGDHERVQEGAEMLLDRQLPHGGWNYGNTFVWGQELRPFPETTGMALNALADRVSEDKVKHSLQYLLAELPTIRTPVALGWSLLGLSAWKRQPAQGATLIQRCFTNQARYGRYSTTALCLLLAASIASQGLESLFGFYDKTPIQRAAV